MNSKIVSIFCAVAVIAFLGAMIATPAMAQFEPPSAEGTGASEETEATELIRSVTLWVLGITGAVAVLFIIYGGFRYITASGNQTNMQAAKDILIKAIIGLVIVLVAYVIIQAVLSALT